MMADILNICSYFILFSCVASSIISLIIKVLSRNSKNYVNVISCVFVSIAMVSSWIIFYHIIQDKSLIIENNIFEFISINNKTLSWSIYIDSLSSIMLILITTVSTLVHLYSTGYMSHEKNYDRFMCYISLFTFFMILLVVSNNLIQLFVGWEGVGLCSYLLIGYWFKRKSANIASMKAFMVNRVSDFFFIIGISIVLFSFGSLNFEDVLNQETIVSLSSTSGFNIVDTIATLLFLGAMGKSAQIIFHVWLPDAMEGPTPVSALIHAATMVTAGIFLVCRFSPLYEHSEFAKDLILIVGSVTAIFAASVALVQNDIKKIVAYSTCSQLGYMFAACGVGAYNSAIFHLITHGFFKALLFLCAGSIIFVMHHEQDIRKISGLGFKHKGIFLAISIGTLSICGVPFFSGYYSKDAILESVFLANTMLSNISVSILILSALFTVIYSFKIIFVVFFSPKNDEKTEKLPHSMGFVISVLSIFAIIAGFVGEKVLHITSSDGGLLSGSLQLNIHHHESEFLHIFHYMPYAIILLGISIAYFLFLRSGSLNEKISRKLPRFYNALINKIYFDAIYERLIIKNISRLSSKLNLYIELSCDKIFSTKPASLIGKSSLCWTRVQDGNLGKYIYLLLSILSGISIMMIILFFFA
jgi:NADH-quinone oxidoreductase subunit L